MTYGYCVYHEIECDYKGGCIDCPHNTIEDIEWFKQDEGREERGRTMMVDGYIEWLEKLIVDSEMFAWICEDTPCPEWCNENCNYSSIQAECLRHIYGEKVE